jgi:hypothetical protein
MGHSIVCICVFLTVFPIAVNGQNTCTKASIAGPYGYATNGFVVQSSGFLPFADLGSLNSDGNGNFVGVSTPSQGGHIVLRTLTGTYAVNSDCTGSASFTDSLGTPLHVSFVIADNGQEIRLVQTDSGTVVSGAASKQATNCTGAELSGPYAFVLSGWFYDSSGAGQAFADSGVLVSDGLGNLSADDTFSQAGSVASRRLSGTYTLGGGCTGSATFTDGQGNSSHHNFVLVDSGREVLFIQTDANTTISGSAEQVFPQQTSAAVSGGSMPQVASGGGWQTTFTLVNTGTSSAQAQLSFFDNNGNPLPLPLTFVQSGTNSTAVSINQTIAPGDELVVLTSGSNTGTSVVGSAQLTSDGSIGGFAIFRYNPTGQEAVVPLETRNSSAYLLAFDNTNGVGTGLALANVSNQAANVPIVLRDDTGASLGTATINLAAHGHTSFMLTGSYGSVAGKRGTVEFDTPAGGQISVLGLRATPTGAVTTIPVLTK